MGGVVAAGLAAAVVLPALLGSDLRDQPGWFVPVHVVLVAAASAAIVRIRVRSATAGTSWTDSAILICIVSLPPGWVVPVVLAGVFLGKLLSRVRPYRALYNGSKDALSATAGLLVAMLLHLPTVPAAVTQPHLLILVALTITVVEFAVGVQVIALVSRMPWYRVHRDDADIKATFFAGKLAVTILALLLFADDPKLLALVSPAALCLHMLVAGRLRARSDRVAWQRLARSTEKLGGADLDTVLSAAAGDAVSLFAAEQAEVFLRDGPRGPRLAREDARGVVWSGDAALAPPQAAATLMVSAPMVGEDGQVGEVRLHYGDAVSLSDRELLTLRTFASAVRAAARNASALTVADDMARDARRHDALTGLANRVGLHEHGESLLQAPGLVALVTLDLDRVRQVNESLGHAAGDRVLVEVARRLSTVAGPDDLVARLHGDVFAVLLGAVDSSRDARDRAAALLASLEPPLDAGGVRVRVEATAGLAERLAEAPMVTAGAASLSMTELLRRADVAMRQAKRGGPRVVRYEPAGDPADVDALILGGELPRAIARREFTVCFQPIVDLRSGLMIAAEALARWRHPVRGELDPRRFLHAVERSGLLASFDEAVLDQALLARERWSAAGITAPVAVNAAPRSVLDPEYPQRVREALSRHGVSGAELLVELTESLTLDDVELAEPALAQLRADGVRLALDDFGTRSSPLAMVTRLPFVDLKIDRSFVETMTTSPESRAVVRSTVELGRSLGRTVVAEGVEREDQRRALVEMGCPAGQGHLFGRALPIDDLMMIISPGLDGLAGRLARPLD
jgi:diguanylate cyclase (GGDEF)-like protein